MSGQQPASSQPLLQSAELLAALENRDAQYDGGQLARALQRAPLLIAISGIYPTGGHQKEDGYFDAIKAVMSPETHAESQTSLTSCPAFAISIVRRSDGSISKRWGSITA